MTEFKAFRIEGTFPMGVNKIQGFARELVCKDETEARETILSLIGSEHAIERRYIKITSIKALKPEEIKTVKAKRALGVK